MKQIKKDNLGLGFLLKRFKNFHKIIAKTFEKISSHKINKFFFIPLGLIFLWFALSMLLSYYMSFSVLQYPQKKSSVNNFNGQELFKNSKVTGIFTAKEDHLGIVSVKFGEIHKIDTQYEDIIVFKIKEVGDNSWKYKADYRTGSFTTDEYFTFGFPEIQTSKNKEYQFEILSLNGNKTNSVVLGNTNPPYYTKYKFGKHEIFNNGVTFKNYMQKKTSIFFSNSEYLRSSIIFLLPFIFYLMWLSFPYAKFFQEDDNPSHKKLVTYGVSLLIVFELVLHKDMINALMLVFLGLWIFITKICNLKHVANFYFSLALIIITIVCVFLNIDFNINKTTSFAFYLIIVGFFQNLIEYRRGKD